MHISKYTQVQYKAVLEGAIAENPAAETKNICQKINNRGIGPQKCLCFYSNLLRVDL
jgi:hypothetical protein